MLLKIFQFCKLDDFFIFFVHESARVAQKRPAKIGVFAHGQIVVKAAGKLQQGGDAAMHRNMPAGRLHNTRYCFQQRAFPRAV